MQTITITIPIVPRAQKRARSRIAGRPGKQFVQVYTDTAQRTEQDNFRALLYQSLPDGFAPISGAVSLSVIAFMPIPACSKRQYSNYRNDLIFHTKKPDLDNLVKHVKDCCKGVVWLDDKQVVNLLASKKYGEPARWEIQIGLEVANAG
jgi:Holliday junction resolvase RusA-like endonuclease